MEDYITVYKRDGTEVHLTRDEFWQHFISGKVKEHWNDHEQLASVAKDMASKGLYKYLKSPALRLIKLKPEDYEGHSYLASALFMDGKKEEAISVFENYTKLYGRNATILANYSMLLRGDKEREKEVLREALEIDPNMNKALPRYVMLCSNGEIADEGWMGALYDIAKVPGSWAAQLMIGIEEVRTFNNINNALMYFEYVLDCTKQISVIAEMVKLLNKQGYAQEALNLILPVYDIEKYSPLIGIGLMESYYLLGASKQAKELLENLYKLDMPPYIPMLNEWSAKLSGFSNIQ